MTDILVQQSARHSVYTQRFAGHLANLFDPYMDELIKELKAIMAYAPETTQDMRRINQIVREYQQASIAIYGEYNDEILLDELREFTIDEAEFSQEGLQSAINTPDFETTRPSNTQLWAAIRATPLVFPDSQQAKLLEPFIRDWERGQIDKVNNIIRTGFITGRTNQQIVQDVAGKNGYLQNQNMKSIKSMVRTSTNHVSNTARQRTYADNDDIVTGYEWVSTLDLRTSSICRSLDGNVYKYDDPKAPKAPAHPNCLLGDTNVTTSSSVSNIYKRAFKGTMIQITCESGRNITITPNHPVLTCRGWVKATEINKADKLIAMSESAIIKHEENGISSKFEDMSSSFDIPVDSDFVTSRPTTTKDFHGDGIANGYVDIIDVHGFRRDTANAGRVKKVKNHSFILRGFINRSLERISSFNLFSNTSLPSSRSNVCSRGKLSDLFRSASVHSGLLLLRSISKSSINRFKVSDYWGFATLKAKMVWDSISSYSGVVSTSNGLLFGIGESNSTDKGNGDSVIGEDSFNWFFANAEELPDLLASESIDGVELDNVVNLVSREFNLTHVYNLENDVNWYTSNGIITHNCRSTTAPVLDARFNIDDDDETRASKGVEGGQQVSANTTYYSWLKEQGDQGAKGRAFVEDVLGKERAKLFLDGGLSVDQFKRLTIDELFQPIPLSELRKKRSLQLAFDKIG